MIRFLFLDLPDPVMKPLPSTVQAVRRLIGIQSPVLAITHQICPADAVGKTARDGAQPHLLCGIGFIGAAQQHFTP